MMPSRGLRPAQVHTFQRLLLPTRASSTTSPLQARPFSKKVSIPQPSRVRGITHINSLTRPQRCRTPQLTAANSLVGLRMASTSTAETSTSTNPSSPTATELPSLPNVDTITINDLDLEKFTEGAQHVGDLAKLGIDYGYGPTSILQWVLENFHVTAGLPWWASIAATAAVLRIFLFPLFLKSADSSARQAALASIIAPIQKRITECQKAKDQQGTTQAFQEMMAVRKQAGIRFRDQFAPLIFQAVFGICGFRLINAMASLPVPGFTTGGFSWLSDLTVSDPFLILPVLMGVSMHIVGRIGGESGAGVSAGSAPGTPAQMRTLLLYVMPVAITVIMGWQPAGLAVWFATSGFLGLSQAFLLKNDAVRRLFRISPIYKPSKQEAAESNPLNSLMSTLSAKTSTPATSASTRTTSPEMRLQYQAPNLNRTTSDGKIIKPMIKSESAVEGRASSTWVAGLKNRWDSAKESQKLQAEAKAVEKAKEARARAAQAYEDRAKKMGR